MTRLYDLLPAVHRVRDAEAGSPLEGLLGTIDDEVELIRADIEQLYDNWFIETCEDWVVPYLGDLLGVKGLGGPGHQHRDQRAFVANTLRYRRRKGTAAVLEQLAHDVTGWTSKAVEFFELIGWNQNLNHLRLDGGGPADLHDADRASLADSAFDGFAHTADVRHVDTGAGRHNIPNIGLFLWRLQAYPLARNTAGGSAEQFTFDPIGRDMPLFNQPSPEATIEHLATEHNVEAPVRRRPLYDELHPDLLSVQPATADRYLGTDPVLAVWLDGAVVPTDGLSICNLEDTNRRAEAPAVVAVDPVLGRLALRAGDARIPEVSWSYGFSGPVGGGPYDRRASVGAAMSAAEEAAGNATWWEVGVSRELDTVLVADLAAAVAQYTAQSPLPLALIAVTDDRTYAGGIEIIVPAGTHVVLAAGDWKKSPDPKHGPDRRRPGDIAATETRPTIAGDIRVRGDAGAAGQAPGTLVIDGFLIDGTVTVEPGALGSLRLAHSTLVPGAAPSLVIQAGGTQETKNAALVVVLDHVICGSIQASEYITGIGIADSIVKGSVDVPDLRLERCTVIGPTASRTMSASESIFTELVSVARRQTGCVRYSWLPPASRVPRRFRCQPADAAAASTIHPTFTSTALGDPGFAQLAASTPLEILQGAQNEGEMGAFNALGQPRRLADLRARLDEYLRLGLEAGVFFAT